MVVDPSGGTERGCWLGGEPNGVRRTSMDERSESIGEPGRRKHANGVGARNESREPSQQGLSSCLYYCERYREKHLESPIRRPDPGRTNPKSGQHDLPCVTEGQPESEGNEDADPVELGVQLLERLEHHELSLAQVIDRIETVTTHPARTREILDTAEKRGIIERADGVVRVTGGRFLAFQSEVVRREGEFTCRRCGASLSVGHFMKLEAGELGPFGSSCIRKVTGREED